MPRNPDVPDSWPPVRPTQQGGGSHIPGSPPTRSSSPKRPIADSRIGTTPQPGAKPARRTDAVKSRPKQQVISAKSKTLNSLVPQGLPLVATDSADAPLQKSTPSKRLSFLRKWPFWAVMLVLMSSGVGFVAVALLFKLPAVPNCPTIFWPMASASLRLYCAQLAANKQTAEDLLEAINLVNSLPGDHPLRPEINRHIEQWSLEILKLGEQAFQAGKLEEAVSLARKIPTGIPAQNLVEKRIERWQTIWAEAEEIYQKAEQMLRQSNWHMAFEAAVRLTRLSNNYWSQNKYEELVGKIQTAKEESAQLDKAYKLVKSGKLDDLLEAIKIAQAISSNSYAYKEAKDLLADCGNKLLALAQERLDSRDWKGVLQVVNKIPPSLSLQDAVQDFTDLANAGQRAAEGTAPSIEEAIALAQKLDIGRPLHEKAQDLIARWQREIQDVAHLQQARELAQPGGINDLMAAIAEAQLIPQGNPRYEEAKSQIQSWTNQIQTTQDRPYLDHADQLASLGDPASLQDAVEQAGQIGKGRALYQEAQSKIQQWNSKIQQMQDQPILDQADSQANSGDIAGAIATAEQIRPGRSLYREAQSRIRQWTEQSQRREDQPYLDQAQALANSGNISSAIDSAHQIRPGRALYDDAQAKIRGWQREITARQQLQSAQDMASSGTPEALASAIRLARQVSQSSSVADDAREASNNWSYQLLAIAQKQADANNIPKAIAIAKTIPPRTNAYESAQMQIQAWQKSNQPQ